MQRLTAAANDSPNKSKMTSSSVMGGGRSNMGGNGEKFNNAANHEEWVRRKEHE